MTYQVATASPERGGGCAVRRRRRGRVIETSHSKMTIMLCLPSIVSSFIFFYLKLLEECVMAACDAKNRSGFQQIRSQGSTEPIKFELYYIESSNTRQLVFIEDPENGLCHQYLKSFADEMIKSVGTGFSKQLFVTTHSPFFVNALSPRNVWVLTKGDDGFSTIKRASEYDFVSKLSDEGVPLGDMWYSNYFG